MSWRRMICSLCGVPFCVFICGTAHAYKDKTHVVISDSAYWQSVAWTYMPEELRVPESQLLGSLGGRGTALDWIREGSWLEDKHFSRGGLTRARYRNRFHNPRSGAPNDGGLSGFWNGRPAPEWARGVGDSSGNDYSWLRAREFFYRGLTEPDQWAREEWLASTFRAIGQIVHLVEDAAQPQHTRNDSHVLGSLYEDHAEGCARKQQFVAPYWRYDPVYGEADPATFSYLRSYWDRDDGKGLAEYSNRGFVSAGTNDLFGHSFPSPNWQGSQTTTVDVQNLQYVRPLRCGYAPPNLSGEIKFIGTPVNDDYRGPPEFNPYTTTYSLFDDRLLAKNKTPAFTLNRYNFEAAWDFLIPRAVGYSAGLINYFFRGKMDVEQVVDCPPSNPNCSSPELYFRVTNLSPEAMVSGQLQFFVDDAHGYRHELSWSPVNITDISATGIEAGESILVPNLGTSGTPLNGQYTVVFHGTMGLEVEHPNEIGAVAGKVFGGGPPFLIVTADGSWAPEPDFKGWNVVGAGIPNLIGYATGFRCGSGLFVNAAPNMPSLLMVSRDNAASWTNLSEDLCEPQPYGYWCGFARLDGTNMVAASRNWWGVPSFYGGRSPDCGATWYPPTQSANIAQLDSMVGMGGAGGLLFGRMYNQNFPLWWSADGNSWVPMQPTVDGFPVLMWQMDTAAWSAGGWPVFLNGGAVLAGGDWNWYQPGWGAGIIRSVDNGETWSTVFPGGAPSAMAAAPGGLTLAAFWVSEGDWLWASEDHGSTWHSITADLPAELAPYLGDVAIVPLE